MAGPLSADWNHQAPGSGGAPARADFGPTYQCEGLVWASSIPAHYTPTYCYGHDEPTMSYLSNAPGSGANASWTLTLPADGKLYPQANFYAAFWFGGVVYDTGSTGGGNQGFLEVQFYPAPPVYTGTGSGTKDCLSNGAFNPSFSAQANQWFACAIVWQLQNSGGFIIEDAAIALPLEKAGTTAIMVMNSNDHLLVNYSGIAQSTTQGWTISVDDLSANQSGSVTLQNGSVVLSPYYSQAAAGNTLYWGASNPGAVSFSYEIGHSLNASAGGFSCNPGDGTCASYWPTRWAASPQMELGLPIMGSGLTASYASQMVLSSSQGGESEVNASCSSPSTSPSKNCLYPYYQYRSSTYSFTFGTSPVLNDTHDYGNIYQFPATTNSIGQWLGNTRKAPWGHLHLTVTPKNATVYFSRPGQLTPLPLSALGTATGSYLEGPYWLNASAPGCSHAHFLDYLRASSGNPTSVSLACGPNAPPLKVTASGSPLSGTAPLSVGFSSSASGGTSPYQYSWDFGDRLSANGSAPTHSYRIGGNYTATVAVLDAAGGTATATVNVSVSPLITASCADRLQWMTSGSVATCALVQGQTSIFELNVSRSQWSAHKFLDVYESDGQVSGAQPVFAMGVGMSGAPYMSNAVQTANGPNATISVSLSHNAPNTYGGWGTYWVVVNSPGGTGGYCVELRLSTSSATAGPACSAASGGTTPLVDLALASPPAGGVPLKVNFTGLVAGGTSPYTFHWAFGDGNSATAQSPTHTYATVGTYSARITTTDANGTKVNSSVSVTVRPLSPSCAGANQTIVFKQLVMCHLGTGLSTIYQFNVTKSQWFHYYYVDVFEQDGSANGTQPVFTFGTGLGGTPSLANATQTATGPSGVIQLRLNNLSAGVYGGWGTYWIVVSATGGTGGFCLVAKLANGLPGAGPTCVAAMPRLGSSGPSGRATSSPISPIGGTTLGPISIVVVVPDRPSAYIAHDRSFEWAQVRPFAV